jgi:hypothetical protein
MTASENPNHAVLNPTKKNPKKILKWGLMGVEASCLRALFR